MVFSGIFKKSKVHVGLDLGSSTIRMVVAAEQRDGGLKLLASCQTPSAGIRHGIVVDPQMVLLCLRDLIADTEQSAQFTIKEVLLSVGSGGIKGLTNHASFRLPDEDFLVDDKHIALAMDKARALDLDHDRFILNEQCGRFYIDRRETTHFPIGLAGRTLELDCHLITVKRDYLLSQVDLIRQIGLEVKDLCFGPVAAAQSLLKKQQKEDGALLIDLGAATSNYICYRNGDILASGSILKGSDEINTIIIQQRREKISHQGVEILKCQYGDAFGDINDASLVSYQDEIGLRNLKIERGLLNDIICKHYASIFGSILKELREKRALNRSMNIYLIGGGSLMKNIDELAMHIFDMPVVARRFSKDEKEDKIFRDERCFFTALGLTQMAALG